MALVELGPVKPNSMAMLQLAAPGNTASASAGSRPRGPASRKPFTCASANATPPSAEPIMAPTRSASSRAGSSSASATASRALATASCEKRSSRLARFAARWSRGRKSGISAAMRLRNGVGSKRVISRTAERRAVSPAHRPSTAVPMGVTAPTPVIRTRRLPLFIWSPLFTPGSAGLRWSLDFPFDPGERSRRDPLDEHRADHQCRRKRPDERPRRSAPLVNDCDEDTVIPGVGIRGSHPEAWARRCTALKRSVLQDNVSPSPGFSLGTEAPHDIHSSRHTPHVTIPDFARQRVDRHLRHPPGGIADRAERAPSGHLDGAAAVAAVQKPDPAVMRQDMGPTLDLTRELKDASDRRTDQDLVDGAHGSHEATILNPGRYLAAAATPASASIVSSSRRV